MCGISIFLLKKNEYENIQQINEVMTDVVFTVIAECDSDSSSDEDSDPLWSSMLGRKSVHWSMYGSTIKGTTKQTRGYIYIHGPGSTETHVVTNQSHTVREILEMCQCDEICDQSERYQLYICDEVPLDLNTRVDESSIVFWNQTIVIVDTFYKYWKWNALFPSPRRRYISNDWNIIPYEPVEEVQSLLKDGAVWVEILWSYTPTIPDSFQVDRHWWVTPKRKNEYMLKSIPADRHVRA